jgi:hypothetical protein
MCTNFAPFLKVDPHSKYITQLIQKYRVEMQTWMRIKNYHAIVSTLPLDAIALQELGILNSPQLKYMAVNWERNLLLRP